MRRPATHEAVTGHGSWPWVGGRVDTPSRYPHRLGVSERAGHTRDGDEDQTAEHPRPPGSQAHRSRNVGGLESRRYSHLRAWRRLPGRVVSLIPVAAALIWQAAADENYSQNLHDAVNENAPARHGLVDDPIEETELGWLSPSEWLWFARWRQDRGGSLDPQILSYLDLVLATASRASRFEFRGLIMRDPAANLAAAEAMFRQGRNEDVGLQTAQRHARNFPDSLEVARDAVQYATPAAWFTIRALTSLDDRRARQVRGWLEQIAAQRQVDPEITDLWEFTN